MTTTERGLYVYGIVPADVEIEPDASGVGNPPGEISTVAHGEIAALVSSIATDEVLGRPEDLEAHAALLDGAAAEVPVLPMTFGGVLSGPEQVTEELLIPHHDEFAGALRELEGKAEFIVHGRYRSEAVFAEILQENPKLEQLRQQVRSKSEDAGRNDRIALGEAVNNALAGKRETDTAAVANALGELDLPVAVREPTHEEDAVHLACLVEIARQEEFESAVERIADEWEGRVQFRLLGPLAPYDFVVSKVP
jgi:Gas vesicle synthesis protein GvpL/GvpF